MKFLQIKNTADGKPKLITLSTGNCDTDYNSIDIEYVSDSSYYHVLTNQQNKGIQAIKIDDCYQSRPLIEIDGFCEFDVVSDTCGNSELDDEDNFMLLTFGWGTFNTSKYSPCNNTTFLELKSHGSIFLPENQKKYPELYAKALSLLVYKSVYGSHRI